MKVQNRYHFSYLCIFQGQLTIPYPSLAWPRFSSLPTTCSPFLPLCLCLSRELRVAVGIEHAGKYPGALVAKLRKPQQSLPYGHLLVEPRTTKIHQRGVESHKQSDWSSLYLWNSFLEESGSIEEKHMFTSKQLSAACSSWKQHRSPWGYVILGGFVTQDPLHPSLLGWTVFPGPPSALCLRDRQSQPCLINYLTTVAIRQKINEGIFVPWIHCSKWFLYSAIFLSYFVIFVIFSCHFFHLWKDSTKDKESMKKAWMLECRFKS